MLLEMPLWVIDHQMRWSSTARWMLQTTPPILVTLTWAQVLFRELWAGKGWGSIECLKKLVNSLHVVISTKIQKVYTVCWGYETFSKFLGRPGHRLVFNLTQLEMLKRWLGSNAIELLPGKKVILLIYCSCLVIQIYIYIFIYLHVYSTYVQYIVLRGYFLV